MPEQIRTATATLIVGQPDDTKRARGASDYYAVIARQSRGGQGRAGKGLADLRASCNFLSAPEYATVPFRFLAVANFSGE